VFDNNSSKIKFSVFLFVCILHLLLVIALITHHAKSVTKQQSISISLYTIPKSENAIEKSNPSPTLPEKKITHKKQVKIQPVKSTTKTLTPPPIENKPQPPHPVEALNNNNNPVNNIKRLYIAPTNEKNHPIPQALFNPKPPYPGEAFDNKQEGTVILDVKVAQSGRVLDVKLHESSHYHLLDESALETVKLWIFDTNSIPQEEWIRIPINFKIIDK